MRLIDRFNPPRREPTAVRGQVVDLVESWRKERPVDLAVDFKDYVQEAYYANGVVAALIIARASALSQAAFRWRRNDTLEIVPETLGSPNQRELNRLRSPWPNGTFADLVWRLEQDASLSGNAYLYRPRKGVFQRLRPDWVTILHNGSHPTGYGYGPPGDKLQEIDIDEMVHYAPEPDPLSPWRGKSWVQSVAKEIIGDNLMEKHKRKFFEHAATPNLVITFQEALSGDAREQTMELVKLRHQGADNAYRTMFVDNGADVQVVGSTLEQLSFTEVQGHGETRICSAANTPPIIIGVTEGLESATYSNYGQAKRHWIDVCLRHLWGRMVQSVETVMAVPPGHHLWYDDRHIPLLQQDALDAAQIRAENAAVIRNLTDAGYDPDSVVKAVLADDLRLLTHSGLFSVQLQPAGAAVPGVSPDDGETTE